MMMRLVVSSAIIGLLWTSLTKGLLVKASTSRCDTPPCSCDQFGRLTCLCKDDAEVINLNNNFFYLFIINFLFEVRITRVELDAKEAEIICGGGVT